MRLRSGDEGLPAEAGAGRDAELEHWLQQVIEDEHDAADAAFSLAGDGLETLGDLLDADLSDEDVVDVGMSTMSERQLRAALEDAAARGFRDFVRENGNRYDDGGGGGGGDGCGVFKPAGFWGIFHGGHGSFFCWITARQGPVLGTYGSWLN